MLTVISPAKTLDFETAPTTRRATQPEFIEQASALVDDARALSPEDIAGLVAFLASEEAGFITGQVISVSGGLTMA